MRVHGKTVKQGLLSELEDALSAKDFRILERLCDRFGLEESLSLGECARLVTGGSDEEHMALLRAFRARVRNAAKTINGLDLNADSAKRTPIDDRTCWFEIPDATMARLAGAGLQALTAGHGSDPLVPPSAVQTTMRKVTEGKRPVRLAFLYADGSADKARDLIERMRPHCGASEKLDFQLVDLGHAPAGFDRRGHRASVINADMVFALLCPAFLTDRELMSNLEMAAENWADVIPIQLADLSVHHDLGWLADLQIEPPPDKDSFTRLRNPQKDKFCLELFEKLHDRPEPRRKPRSIGLTGALKGWHEPIFVRSHAMRANAVPRGEEDIQAIIERGQGQDALAALREWVKDPKGSSYCAVLGEYGIGKTTVLREFAFQCNSASSDLPPAIFIDLRAFSASIHNGQVPHLEEFLDEVLRREWRSGSEQAIFAKDVLRMVRKEGATLIFDGLDEKLVHLDGAQGRAFLRELWGALPPQREGEHGPAGRLVFSCRSHFFATLNDQASMLTAEGRDHIRHQDYLTLLMLPFDERQIREYLGQALGADQADHAIRVIGEIHNLTELCPRPFLLSIITGQIQKLERARREGRTLRSVDLYRNLADDWLNRDDGKHHLKKTDKLRLMTDLAVAMWQSGDREWPWDRLDTWVAERVAQDPSMAYPNLPPELLAEDFRTATFILRPDSEVDRFRFAHTSIQEYFLARGLVEALRHDRAEDDWALPLPSDETFAFLGELIEQATDRERLIGRLELLLGRYRAQTSENVFKYWLVATKRGLPDLSPSAIDLRGAQLDEWTIEGREGHYLPLAGADLREASLWRAELRYVDLSNANLSGASAYSSVWRHFLLDRACLTNFQGEGSVLRHGSMISGEPPKEGLHSWRGAIFTDCEGASYDVNQGSSLQHDLNMQRGTSILSQPELQDAVWACAFSPCGERVLTASDDRTLKIWDAKSGKLVRTLKGHQDAVLACAFSPGGERILSASSDHTLKIWDAKSGKLVRTLKGHQDAVLACAFSPGGERILTASDDQTLKIWDAQSGNLVRTLEGHLDAVRACAFSPGGERVLSASVDHTLKIWDAQSGKLVRTLEGHQASVLACAFSPDGERVLSASFDQTLKIWDAQNGKLVRTLEGHQFAVGACAFSPDGKRVLSASFDQTLKIWDAQNGKLVRTLEGHQDVVRGCAFSPHGERVLSASDDRTLKIWDTQSGKLVRTLEGHQYTVAACAFSPNGERVLSASRNKTLKIWDAQNGTLLRTFNGHQDAVWACAFSPDGERVLSASWDQTLKIWDAKSGKLLRTLKGHQNLVLACAFSPDGERVLSASWDQTLKVWDAKSGKLVRTLEGHQDVVRGCAFSPDGQRVVSASDDRALKIWDAKSGKLVRTLEGHQAPVLACAFSPDGERVLSASWDQTLKVWDAKSGKLVRNLEGHQDVVRGCAFSPDGQRVLSASVDHTLKIWDAQNGKLVRTLEGHQDAVLACTFSPDGERVLSASSDQTLKIWDVQSGAPLWTFVHAPDDGWAVIDETTQRFTDLGEEAWRYVHYVAYDEARGREVILPPEYFMEAARSQG